jgi:hypothetical protein
MDAIIHGFQPKYGFFSGIHGDEWSIISSVGKTIDTYKNNLGSFLYIPTCSPSAIHLKTRKNGEGIDLNRAFTQNSHSHEALEIITLLKPYTFDLCVDFHEDIELPGVYVYDSINIEGSDLLTSFRNQIKAFVPLYSGTDDTKDHQLGGMAFEGYRVSPPPEKDSQGNFIYEGFLDYWALIEEKTKRWMTLEVPTNFSEFQKDKVVDIFFQTFIFGKIV